MGHTLFLCSVSLLACQAADGQVTDYPAVAVQSVQDQAPPASKGPLGLGIWDKMRNFRITGWFSRPQPVETAPPPYQPSAAAARGIPPVRTVSSEPPVSGVPVTEPVMSEPVTSEPAAIPATLRSSQPTAPVTPAGTGTLNPKFAEMSGHESDYSWITGQLNFVDNQWLIEYAAPGTVDRFSGKLVLENVEPRDLRIGDLVCVSGKLTSPGNGLKETYRVSEINLIERQK